MNYKSPFERLNENTLVRRVHHEGSPAYGQAENMLGTLLRRQEELLSKPDLDAYEVSELNSLTNEISRLSQGMLGVEKEHRHREFLKRQAQDRAATDANIRALKSLRLGGAGIE